MLPARRLKSRNATPIVGNSRRKKRKDAKDDKNNSTLFDRSLEIFRNHDNISTPIAHLPSVPVNVKPAKHRECKSKDCCSTNAFLLFDNETPLTQKQFPRVTCSTPVKEDEENSILFKHFLAVSPIVGAELKPTFGKRLKINRSAIKIIDVREAPKGTHSMVSFEISNQIMPNCERKKDANDKSFSNQDDGRERQIGERNRAEPPVGSNVVSRCNSYPICPLEVLHQKFGSKATVRMRAAATNSNIKLPREYLPCPVEALQFPGKKLWSFN